MALKNDALWIRRRGAKPKGIKGIGEALQGLGTA
jgi:hypothetical protein